jgi:hypothetical protein
MRYLLPVLAVLLVLIVGCPPITTLEAPTVTKAALDTDYGGTLRLSWTAVASATEYYIYFDGHTTKDTSITGTSIDISAPYSKVEVTAHNSTSESEPAAIDCKAVTTPSVTVYFTSDGTHPENAIGFTTGGTCTAMGFSTPADIDFVLDDTSTYQGSTVAGFWSPDMYPTPYNGKDNAVVAAASTDFDAFDIATTPGTYMTRLAITSGALYSAWIDRTNNAWSTDDNFAKIKVEAISGTTITLKTAYQKIGGLRWLVSM